MSIESKRRVLEAILKYLQIKPEHEFGFCSWFKNQSEDNSTESYEVIDIFKRSTQTAHLFDAPWGYLSPQDGYNKERAEKLRIIADKLEDEIRLAQREKLKRNTNRQKLIEAIEEYLQRRPSHSFGFCSWYRTEFSRNFADSMDLPGMMDQLRSDERTKELFVKDEFGGSGYLSSQTGYNTVRAIKLRIIADHLRKEIEK